jgi:hypothetical protein
LTPLKCCLAVQLLRVCSKVLEMLGFQPYANLRVPAQTINTNYVK